MCRHPHTAHNGAVQELKYLQFFLQFTLQLNSESSMLAHLVSSKLWIYAQDTLVLLDETGKAVYCCHADLRLWKI